MDPLNSLERRVLGALLEKSLTQPEYYPMTLNALVAACNQKSNRDPLMELDEEAVWSTLESLRGRGLISRVLPAPGGRTDRFKHDVDTKLEWPKPQKAVMTELLLRGPQTVGELRTRASRMYAFENIESVSAVLDWLSQQSPPLVAPMARVPGQSAIRFTHLLYPPEEAPGAAPSLSSEPRAPIPPAAASTAGVSPPPSRAATSSSSGEGELNSLREQVEGMAIELAELHETVAELRRRLDTLEGR